MTRAAAEQRTARTVRVREAASRGIRVVPANPGPEFTRFLACDFRPRLCGECAIPCISPFGEPGGAA